MSQGGENSATGKEKEEVMSDHVARTAQSMSTIPKLNISAAESNVTEWEEWWQHFELYLLSTGLDKAPEKRKVAIMLHTIGGKALQIYNAFNINMDEVTLKEVKKKFDRHFEPRKNITMIRYLFFTKAQKPGESIEQFLTELENTSARCEFQQLRQSLVRDVLIANLNPTLTNVRQRLLQENDPTLERTIELAKTVILAQQDAEKMGREASAENVLGVNQRSQAPSQSGFSRSMSRHTNGSPSTEPKQRHQGRQTSPSDRVCGRCGQQHRYKCPAFNVRYRSCQALGHFAKFCFKTQHNIRNFQSQECNEDEDEANGEFFIGTPTNNDNELYSKQSWYLNVIVNKVEMKCVLDSGADINVMSLSTYKGTNLSQSQFDDCQKKIIGFGGKEIPVIGQ